MLSFMVIALPRSGTTWAANWLTTDKTLCLHDPLFTRHYTELDDYWAADVQPSKILGVSCTGLWRFPQWVNAHPARKVVLHRPLEEINESLAALGCPTMDMQHIAQLNAIVGHHMPWRRLFDAPKGLYEYLTGLEFDAERHALLKEIEMQPNFAGLTIDKAAMRRVLLEMRAPQ